VMGIPTKFSETPGEVRTAVPLLGQDTKNVLTSLGYDEEAINKMLKAGVVRLPEESTILKK
ncbi:CoA transferase, partial [Peribacillus sp. NPDC060186]